MTHTLARPHTTAELLVRALVDHGVELIFLNPGTDTAPVQEALARLASAAAPVPRVVLCPHEAVALSAAHAYYAATGRPQVVMVHVDVGTQNLGAMLHNASRAEAGVVIIAGRTPRSTHGEERGGRDTPVHWQQDVPDQPGIVRSYVRWSADLTGPQTLPRLLARAFQVATAAPGPVYLTAAREVLMTPVAEPVPAAEPARHGPAAVPAPHPEALHRAVELLAGARRPLVTTTRAGRNPAAVAELVALAELLGAPVIDRRERMNFPGTHPLYVAETARGHELLRRADVVLVVDSDVPWVPARAEPGPDASVILVDHDPTRAGTPGWIFPADVAIQADPELALRALTAGLRGRGVHPVSWAARTGPDTAAPRPDVRTIDPADVAEAVDALLEADDLLVEEATTNGDALRAGVRRTLPGTVFQAGGSGLGWALGAATGLRLAAPRRRVVAVVGDGSFLFSEPVAALWTAHHERTPFLTVVLQNGGYAASRRPVFTLFPDGESRRSGDVVGTRFPDPPDMAALARACHAHGDHVRERDRLGPALRAAAGAVQDGVCAVVVVELTSPWM